jgi:hypothetical protein
MKKKKFFSTARAAIPEDVSQKNQIGSQSVGTQSISNLLWVSIPPTSHDPTYHRPASERTSDPPQTSHRIIAFLTRAHQESAIEWPLLVPTDLDPPRPRTGHSLQKLQWGIDTQRRFEILWVPSRNFFIWFLWETSSGIAARAVEKKFFLFIKIGDAYVSKF